MQEHGRVGEIYRALNALRDRYGDLLRRRYPELPRRVSGFNLLQLLPEYGCHVAKALVGTEGTCVTVLEATLRLVHSPPKRSLLVVGYPDVFMAADRVPDVLSHRPIGLEGMDDVRADGARAWLASHRVVFSPAEAARAVEQVEAARSGALRDRGTGWAYAADELFFTAELPLPTASYYDDWPLTENGVGAARWFLDAFDAGIQRVPPLDGQRLAIATGTRMAPLIEPLARRLEAADRAGRSTAWLPDELAYALFFDHSTRTKSAWAGAAAAGTSVPGRVGRGRRTAPRRGRRGPPRPVPGRSPGRRRRPTGRSC